MKKLFIAFALAAGAYGQMVNPIPNETAAQFRADVNTNFAWLLANKALPASVVTTTFSATPTFTCPSATTGAVTHFKLSTALTANITSSTLATCTSGQILTFAFAQDGTGGRTVAMPTGFSQACQVSPIASAVTKMAFAWDGTTAQLLSCAVDIGPSISDTQAAPSGNPASGKTYSWFDSTAKNLMVRDDAGVVKHGVQTDAGTANNYISAISDAGAITKSRPSCATLSDAGTGCSAANVTLTIASGTASLGTSAIASTACATVVTVAATGVATTDVITFTPNADITGVTGYTAATTGGLSIYPYPTANNVNFKVCNPTSASVTPGAVTLNWRVVR